MLTDGVAASADTLTELYPEASDEDLDTMQMILGSLLSSDPRFRIGGLEGESFRWCEEELTQIGW